MIAAEKFETYDYGYADNYKRYGQSTPISYDLNKVTAPLALFYGANDVLAQKPVRILILTIKDSLAKKYILKRKDIK